MENTLRAVVVAFACTAVFAGTRDDGVPDSVYVEYARGFAPYTPRLEATLEGGKHHYATAVMIGDHWAVTAAHVVDNVEGVCLLSGTTRHCIDEIVVHREWADKFGRDDIALLKSSKPFGLSFYPDLATGEENVGDTVSIVGYGITGRLSTGYDTVDNALRAGTNTIERFENSLIICEARRKSSPFEYCISPGDSGGPLFCRGRLAGINSITMRSGRGGLRSREGEETGHTRVSLYREWIRGVMGGVK